MTTDRADCGWPGFLTDARLCKLPGIDANLEETAAHCFGAFGMAPDPSATAPSPGAAADAQDE